MKPNAKDLLAGFLFISVGAFFCATALARLEIGTALQMGPGYFPVLLSAVLIGFGLVLVVKSFATPALQIGKLSWRGALLVSAGIIAFGAMVQTAGFIPAVAVCALASAYSSRRMTLRTALLVTAGLTAFCVALFRYGLGIPLKLWFTG